MGDSTSDLEQKILEKEAEEKVKSKRVNVE